MKTNPRKLKELKPTTWINLDHSGKDLIVTHIDKNGVKTKLHCPNYDPKDGILVVPITLRN